ncbi:hypothetical protein MMON44395_17940 [Mycolicibacterium monacense DSM 44395]|nr:hypothetical protein [Mycolicibacterium monacense DSM 44395]
MIWVEVRSYQRRDEPEDVALVGDAHQYRSGQGGAQACVGASMVAANGSTACAVM